MHYYKFNISDWALHTAHLSLVEEAIYFRLINFYYDSEKPIPIDLTPVVRRLRMCEESQIVSEILEEFFYETENGFFHKRCEEVLKEYRKTNKKNKLNGAKGGRPAKSKALEETQTEPSGLVVGTQKEPKHNPNYELITKNQELITKNQSKDICASDDAEISDLFEAFWLSGIKKVNKKKAKVIFTKIIKSEVNKPEFNIELIFDVKNRLKLNQMGFAEMHPTTYLNGERWKDDYPENKQHYQQLSTTERTTQSNRESYERTQREIAELEAQINDEEIVGSVQQGTWGELQ